MIQQAKRLLQEKNLPENYKPYTDVRTLLNNNIGYVGTFTKFLLDGATPNELIDPKKMSARVERIKSVYGQLLEARDLSLPKNVIEFDNIEELSGAIKGAKLSRDVKRFVDQFPSTQKQFFYKDGQYVSYETNSNNYNRKMRKVQSNRTVYYFDCERFLSQIVTETNEQQRNFFIRSISAYRDINSLVNRLKNLKSLPDFNTILNEIKSTSDAIITHKDPDNGIIVVRLYAFSACHRLARSTNWCISRDSGNFLQYIRKGKQFMIYSLYDQINNNTYDGERYTIIGITTNNRNKVLDSFDKYNSNCSGSIRRRNILRDLFTEKFGNTYIKSEITSTYETNHKLFNYMNKFWIGRLFNTIIDNY